MIKKLMHNWRWKLLSLVIAVVLWGMIISYDDPLIRVSFTDVPVIVENEEAITSQDRAIEYLEGTTVDILLSGTRSTMEKLSSKDVKAYADLSRVSITNAIDIEVEVNEQVEVLKKEPNEMLIATEQIKSMLKSVQVRYLGELAEDYINMSATVTPNQIEITGPESKIALVSSVVVAVDLDQAKDDVTVFAAPELLDSDSNEIRNLDVNIDQIQVMVPIQKIKTIPVIIQSVGELNENYRLMSISIETPTVTIRGEEEDLEGINNLIINDISLTDMTDETTSLQVNLSSYLPEKVDIYASATVSTVKVDIEAVINTSYIIEQEDINVTQIPEGLQFRFMDEAPYVIGVKGIYKELNELEIADLLPRISLRDLDVGVHDLSLDLSIPSGFELTSDLPTVKVELTEKPIDAPSGAGDGDLPPLETVDTTED